MKKILLLLAVVVLSGATILTSCSKSKKERVTVEEDKILGTWTGDYSTNGAITITFTTGSPNYSFRGTIYSTEGGTNTEYERIADTAEDDWTSAVTSVPSSTPRARLEVRRKSTASSLLPATRLSPSPISVTPYRKKASPARSEITFRKLIGFSVAKTFSIGQYKQKRAKKQARRGRKRPRRAECFC